MKKILIIGGAVIGIGLIGILLLVGMIVGTLNQETALRTAIEAKQKDNTSEFDSMWKVISQTAQVTEEQKKALVEIFNGYAAARTGDGKGGSLANWIKEAVPNVDTSTFNNLQNIIVSKRDGFVMRQKELLDLSREHNKLLNTIPDSFICSFFGRKAIDVVIVTSSRTEDAFKSGRDDSVNVFEK